MMRLSLSGLVYPAVMATVMSNSLIPEVICSHVTDPLLETWRDAKWAKNYLGKKVTYMCKAGYNNTNEEATCTRDGWIPKPLCQGMVHLTLHFLLFFFHI